MVLDLEAELVGQRLDRLHAAHVPAGEDPVDVVGDQGVGDGHRRHEPAVGQRPQVIGLVPVGGAARRSVPHEVDGHG
jgi:hypothetical protein